MTHGKGKRLRTDASLVRGIGLRSATALNMIDMIGVGPFITMPLLVSAMGGPQAMLGWVLGAILALCDGLIWAELGAALPGAGGSYRYLSECYGRDRLGRMMSFLFIWQLSFSAPLAVATGCIGLSEYAGYLWPGLERTWLEHTLSVNVPLLGPLQATLVARPATVVAIGACIAVVLLLYRDIDSVARLSTLLWIGVLSTISWIILAGVTHFNARQAFSFPPGAFALDHRFFTGLGAAMLVATYCYWGYYNVCFLGGEVRDPGKNIPRALLLSIVLVACLYIAMNTSVLGVIPWQQLQQMGHGNTRLYPLQQARQTRLLGTPAVASVMMQQIYGRWAGYLITGLIMWTALSSIFSLLLGYSRVPYAAAVDGNYFSAFAKVHPRHRFPYVSLLWLGAAAAACCFLRLVDVIAALVVIRLLLQFLVQAIGVIVLRVREPDLPRPFRMWLYPAPALMASAGFVFVLVSRKDFLREIRYAVAILVLGIAVYMIRAQRRREWPFVAPERPRIPG
jgi:basic amino acid/polyamine antiporter, APA family